MYWVSLTIALMFILGVFEIGLAKKFATFQNDYRTDDKLSKIELIPQDEYLIGEDTPIYFLRNISGKLMVFPNMIKHAFTAKQRNKFANAATSLVTLSSEEQIFSTESKVTNQYVLNPEILVIIDYDLYSHFNRSYELIIPYVISFWNAVDLKFRSLISVQYRLNIAGIVLAETPDALSYMNRVENVNRHDSFLTVKQSLEASTKWLYENNDIFPLSSYDIAITMTSNILCLVKDSYMTVDCRERRFGLTYRGGACHYDDSQRRTSRTAIVQNEGAHDKVLSTAQTLGLLMSSKTPCNFKKCPDFDRYVMVGVSGRKTVSRWSDNQVQFFLNFYGNIQNSYCLATYTDRGKKIPTYLPGKIMDANEQCKRLGYMKAYRVDPSICIQLNCVETHGRRHIYMTSGAADGTTCGNEKICLGSQCVKTGNKRVIPKKRHLSYKTHQF